VELELRFLIRNLSYNLETKTNFAFLLNFNQILHAYGAFHDVPIFYDLYDVLSCFSRTPFFILQSYYWNDLYHGIFYGVCHPIVLLKVIIILPRMVVIIPILMVVIIPLFVIFIIQEGVLVPLEWAQLIYQL